MLPTNCADIEDDGVSKWSSWYSPKYKCKKISDCHFKASEINVTSILNVQAI